MSTLRLTGQWITVVWYMPSFVWKVFALHYHMKKEKVGQVSWKKELASSNGVQLSFRFPHNRGFAFRVAKSIQLSGTKFFKQIFFHHNWEFEFWVLHYKNIFVVHLYKIAVVLIITYDRNNFWKKEKKNCSLISLFKMCKILILSSILLQKFINWSDNDYNLCNINIIMNKGVVIGTYCVYN